MRKKIKKRIKKNNRPQRLTGHHQVCQHMKNGSPRRREREKGVGRISEVIMAPNFQNLKKKTNFNPRSSMNSKWNDNKEIHT